MYRLVIAEKPSVAMSIAKVLGATARKDGHMEGGGWLISWCIGHLAGLAEPAVCVPQPDSSPVPDKLCFLRPFFPSCFCSYLVINVCFYYILIQFPCQL